MTITDRVLHILRLLRRYKFLTTAQIRTRCVPNDKDGAITREVMRKMKDAGLARRLKAEVHDPLATSSVPVWLPTETGCCVLATKTGNIRYLLDSQPNTNSWQNFAHYVAVSELFLTLDAALALQARVLMNALYFEHDVVNPDETDPRKKFKTYTVVKEEARGAHVHRVVCVPDAACEIQVGPYRRAYYWELERGTDTPMRAGAKKVPGYHGLFESKKFQRHFPEAQDMRVIAVCPNAGWRDAMRRAVAAQNKGADLWLFVAWDEIKPDESFLHGPIVYTCTDGSRPLVKPAATPPAPAPVG